MRPTAPRRPGKLTPTTGALTAVLVLVLASGTALENGATDAAQWVTIAAFTALALLPLFLLTVRLWRLTGGLRRRLQAWREQPED